MTNTGKPNKETYFVDLDGTLILFNIEPERISDRVIPNVFRFLSRRKAEGACLVCTTARTKEHTDLALRNAGIPLDFFDYMLYDLPRGKRFLVNDKENGANDTAQAIVLERDRGFPCETL